MIARANACEYGLASGIISNDVNFINSVSRGLKVRLWVCGRETEGPSTAARCCAGGSQACGDDAGRDGFAARRSVSSLCTFPCSPQFQAGTVWVNCYNVYESAVPFGGYKTSGIGRDKVRSRCIAAAALGWLGSTAAAALWSTRCVPNMLCPAAAVSHAPCLPSLLSPAGRVCPGELHRHQGRVPVPGVQPVLDLSSCIASAQAAIGRPQPVQRTAAPTNQLTI